MIKPNNTPNNLIGAFVVLTLGAVLAMPLLAGGPAFSADSPKTAQMLAFHKRDAAEARDNLEADAQRRREHLENSLRAEKRRIDLKQQAFEKHADRRREALDQRLDRQEKELEEKLKREQEKAKEAHS